MTDETIQAILNRLNRGQPRDIIIRQLADRVYWGFVWGPTASGYTIGGVQRQGDEFFFVKEEGGKFVAAVLRAGQGDMHWYVSKRFRGRRILREPLRATILPFIFATNPHCKTQRGTVETHRRYANPSTRLALGVGFKKVGEKDSKDIYEISQGDVPAYVGLPIDPVDKEQVQRLKRELQISHREVEMLCDVLKVNYAWHFKEEKFDEGRSRVRDGYFYIEDILEDISHSTAGKKTSR